MSFYSANIKSREIEASFSSNQKVQIDIDDGVYLSDMVLTLTPVLSGTMPVGPEGHRFVVNAGVYACINKIVLRSGLQIISQMNKVADVASFYNMLENNGDNGSMNKFLYGADSGYQVLSDGLLHSTEPPQLVFVNPDDCTTFYLPLKNIFGILKSTKYLNTSKLRNLNIIVEFRSDVSNWFQGVVNADVRCDFTAVKPTLLVDQLLQGPGVKAAIEQSKKGQVISYLEIQNDNITVQATGAVTDVAEFKPIAKTDEELDNFTGKYVNRMFVQLVDTTTGIVNGIFNVNKLQKSNAFVAEKLQIRVNNNAIFQKDGIDKPMTKTGYLTNSFGSQNISFGANLHISDIPQFMVMLPVQSIPSRSVGEQSWYGFNVSKQVTSFQVQYERGAYGNIVGDPGQGPTTMNLYGEVLRQLQFTDDGFVIVNV